jgi:hypothetical protein
MTIFTVEITNTSHLLGITAAREAYNSSIPATITVQEPTGEIIENEDTDEMIEQMTSVVKSNPDLIETDADYIQFVMSRAAESYAKQYGA